MRVIVAGSRDFTDKDFLTHILDTVFKHWNEDVTIISGTARGADQLGEQYAVEHNLPVERYPADWITHGKSAGYKRNVTMAENADTLIAFWDQRSKGTKHMIDIAQKHKLLVYICNVSKGENA